MPKYNYVALDARGNETKGSIEVGSQNEAIGRVKEMGLFPTKITEADREDKAATKKAKAKAPARAKAGGKKGKGLNLNIKIPGLGGGVKPKVLTTFTRQLATLVDAGLPLLRGLRVLEKQERNANLKGILAELATSIEGGSTFSEALAQHPKVFNKLFVNMVKAGELGGVLEVVLKRLAEFSEKAQKIKGKVKAALFYPVAVLVVAVGIMILLMTFVVPKFKDVFAGMNITMPGFTLFSTAMGMILLACLAWAWWHFSRKSAAALFGFAWFLVFALPGVMYSHTLGSAAYDYLEHRAYLPMAGIMVLLLFIYNDIPGGKIKNRVANSALFFAFFLGIWSFIYAGNYENPMTFYNQAVASNPASALALDNRGLIRADTKDFRGALEDYDKALSVKHDYAQAYVNKGIALSALNDKQGALVQYDAAIKIKPDLFQAHFNKANTKTGLGLLDEALAEYTLALGISPGYAPGYMARSSVYFNLKNYPAAEQDLTRVLQLDQRNAAAWLNRGKIRYYENNRKGSCDDWTMAASLGEPNAPKLLESYCR